jgi:hypothetical protein
VRFCCFCSTMAAEAWGKNPGSSKETKEAPTLTPEEIIECCTSCKDKMTTGGTVGKVG